MSTRKQIEPKGKTRRPFKEDAMLDAARALLIEGGFHLLTIERVASRMNHSRTTLYKVVASRSFLLGKVALRTASRLENTLARLDQFEGCSRKRIWAMVVGYELFSRCSPEDFALHQLLGSDALRNQMAATDLDELQRIREIGFRRIGVEVEKAISAGDLQIDPSLKAAVMSSLYALASGYLSQFGSATESTRLFQINDRSSSFFRAISVYLDGEQWKPLASQFDYDHLRMEILNQFYPGFL
jgi:AcrR family transcriptional regulator